MWELSSSTAEWKWVGGSTTPGTVGVYGTLGVASAANLPGVRSAAVGWTDGNGDLWLFGGQGADSAGNSGYLNDLWKYHPPSGQWTWMGGSKVLPSCPSTNSCGPSGVYGQLGVAAATNQPGGRSWAAGWIDAKGNFWLFGGTIYGVYLNGWTGDLNDLWTYDPKTNLWTWMGGSDSIPTDCSPLTENCGQPGVYGTFGTPSRSNILGADIKSHGIWLLVNGRDPAQEPAVRLLARMTDVFQRSERKLHVVAARERRADFIENGIEKLHRPAAKQPPLSQLADDISLVQGLPCPFHLLTLLQDCSINLDTYARLRSLSILFLAARELDHRRRDGATLTPAFDHAQGCSSRFPASSSSCSIVYGSPIRRPVVDDVSKLAEVSLHRPQLPERELHFPPALQGTDHQVEYYVHYQHRLAAREATSTQLPN